MRKIAIVLATACVMILVVVFFEFYVEQTTITVQAWNDASICLGSGTGTWMFLYLPTEAYSLKNLTELNFPFPNLTSSGFTARPILIVAWSNYSNFGNSPFYDNVRDLMGFMATKGTYASMGGLEMTVASANPSSITLVLQLGGEARAIFNARR